MAMQCRQTCATGALDSGIRHQGFRNSRFRGATGIIKNAKRSTTVKSLQVTEVHWFVTAAAGVPEPGAVEAPVSALVISAVIVTAVMLGITVLLKPGTDAAAEMQERDAKSGRWRK